MTFLEVPLLFQRKLCFLEPPRKGPFWPDCCLLGPSPPLLGSCLDFPNTLTRSMGNTKSRPAPMGHPKHRSSETGRVRFRRVRFQTPSSVSFFSLSEFLSAYYLCAKANSPSFSQNSPSLPQNSVSSLLRNSTLETVFRPFPRSGCPGVIGRSPIFQACLGHTPGGSCNNTLLRSEGFLEGSLNQRRRDDNKNKIFAFEGGGPWGQRGKSSKNACFFFCGKRHDNKILKVQILLSRNFVVIAQGPIKGSAFLEGTW